MSKIGCYESPCIVTGGTVINDQIQAYRKDLKVSHDRNIGTWKAGNTEAVAACEVLDGNTFVRGQ